MRSPSLPSWRWCALKTRTELHRRGERSSWKAEGCKWERVKVEPTCKKRHRWVTSVGYCGEPGVLRYHGGSGSLHPFGTGGCPACFQCGVASAACGGIGSPGAVVPLYQVTLLASFPSLHHAYHGSLVTPSGNVTICGENTCVTCELTTRWLARVMCDRPDGSHGVGGLSI